MVCKLREMIMEATEHKNADVTFLVVAIIAIAAAVGASLLTVQANKYEQTSPSVHLTERSEMRHQLLGKTEEEVVALIGRPNRTTVGISEGNETWYYDYPPTTSQERPGRDVAMWVKFYESKIVRVEF